MEKPRRQRITLQRSDKGAYLATTIPGGLQVPVPAGRIDGVSVFGQ